MWLLIFYHRDEYNYDLWLRNDLYTNKHTQWFYFRVSNTRANVQYRFTIVNLMKVTIASFIPSNDKKHGEF